MIERYIRTVGQNETFIPTRLQRFLIALEASQSSEEVWQHMLELYAGLGLNSVDYVCATDFRDWQQAQFIRTTHHSSWIEHARRNPNIRKTSYFRTHAIKYLTPIIVGVEYIDVYADVSPERREIMQLAAEMGLRAGIGIPLRMNEPGQAGIITIGGDISRTEFDAILSEHGWTIHASALSAHTRYTELFKSEFVERNRLTPKQRELIELVGRGMMDKQIAHDLEISVSTVRQRLSVVQAKTGAQNRADLAALAMRIGCVPDPLLKKHGSDLTVFLSTGDGKTGTEFGDPDPSNEIDVVSADLRA
jgi:DNA-binding CsgD family transcriptional regulator